MKAVKSPRCLMSGFTLVELVITLVLIGILSALGIGLLASPSTYSAGAARDQFVSTALLAQKHALAAGPCIEVEFSLDRLSNGDFEFLVERELKSGDSCDSSNLEEGVAARRTSEGSDVHTPDLPFTVKYDNSGALIDSSGEESISFTAASSHEACISLLGFAYAGGCR